MRVDSKRKSRRERKVIFDAVNEDNTVARIASRHERARRRKRHGASVASRVCRCVIVLLIAMLALAVPLVLCFDGGRLVGGGFAFDLTDYLPNDSSSPSVDTVCAYYLTLQDESNSEKEADTPAQIADDSQTAVAVDGMESIVENENGERGYSLYGLDLSRGDGKVHINNDTAFSVDTQNLPDDYPIEQIIPFEDMDSPRVLVLHTHATESYTTNDAPFYPESEASPRSSDSTKNVVGIGKELTALLNGYGVPTVHCDRLHDEKSFLTAYKSASESIAEYLEKYPSISYVIDLHRDSIIRENNEKIKPVSNICGRKRAQLMFVIGTDASGASHPLWRNNLAVAIRLQEEMLKNYPTLVRPINLREARFNQQYTNGSFILEVGSCGNTYNEAMDSIQLFAVCFARAVCK